MQSVATPKAVDLSSSSAPEADERGRAEKPVIGQLAALEPSGGDTQSNDLVHVVARNPGGEETQAVCPCSSASSIAKEDLVGELRETLGTEVRKIVKEHVGAVVDGALQPLWKTMDEARVDVQEHGKRVETLAGMGDLTSTEVSQLTTLVQRLSLWTEGLDDHLKQLQADSKSIITKLGALQELQTPTPSTSESVSRERVVCHAESQSSAIQGRDRHRSGTHSHSGSSRRRHSVGGSRSLEEDAARRDRRRKREEEQRQTQRLDRSKDKDKDRDKRRGFFSLS